VKIRIQKKIRNKILNLTLIPFFTRGVPVEFDEDEVVKSIVSLDYQYEWSLVLIVVTLVFLILNKTFKNK